MRARRAIYMLARVVALVSIGFVSWGASCFLDPAPDPYEVEHHERDGSTADGTPCTCTFDCEWDGEPCERVDDCAGDVCWGSHLECLDGVWICFDETCSDRDGRWVEPEACLP